MRVQLIINTGSRRAHWQQLIEIDGKAGGATPVAITVLSKTVKVRY